MHSPDIRYVTSSDATRIAYWEMGDGPGRPIVLIPSQFSSVEFSASDDESLAWHRHIAANRRLVKYDLRGFGLSGIPREADGYSIPRQIDDFRALLDRLELSDVDIWGSYCSVRVALEIAAIEPRVAHVVASGGQSMMLVPYVPPQRNQAIAAIRSVGDLDLWRDSLARYFCGDGPEAQSTAREFAFCLSRSSHGKGSKRCGSLSRSSIRPGSPHRRS